MNQAVKEEIGFVAATTFGIMWRDREKLTSVEDFALLLQEVANQAVELAGQFPKDNNLLAPKMRDLSAMAMRAYEFVLWQSTFYCEQCKSRLSEEQIYYGKVLCTNCQIAIVPRLRYT